MAADEQVERSPARPYSWKQFEVGDPGPRLSHGAYSVLRLTPRSKEIADALRPLVPQFTAADEPGLAVFSMLLARLEASDRALSEIDEALTSGKALQAYIGKVETLGDRLRADVRAWARLVLRYAEALGLTPTSRARLGVDVAAMGWTLKRLHDEADAVDGEAVEETVVVEEIEP